MPHFNISSIEKTKLARFGSRILITKIEVVPRSTDIRDLFHSIHVETVIPRQRSFSYFIHPSSYFDNYVSSARFAATNLPVEEGIAYCKFSTLTIIRQEKNDDREAQYKIHYEPAGTHIEIFASPTFDGFDYALSPDGVREVKKWFPRALIVKSVSVNKKDFKEAHARFTIFYDQVFRALTGLQEKQLRIFSYTVTDTNTSAILYSSES